MLCCKQQARLPRSRPGAHPSPTEWRCLWQGRPGPRLPCARGCRGGGGGGGQGGAARGEVRAPEIPAGVSAGSGWRASSCWGTCCSPCGPCASCPPTAVPCPPGQRHYSSSPDGQVGALDLPHHLGVKPNVRDEGLAVPAHRSRGDANQTHSADRARATARQLAAAVASALGRRSGGPPPRPPHAATDPPPTGPRIPSQPHPSPTLQGASQPAANHHQPTRACSAPTPPTGSSAWAPG